MVKPKINFFYLFFLILSLFLFLKVISSQITFLMEITFISLHLLFFFLVYRLLKRNKLDLTAFLTKLSALTGLTAGFFLLFYSRFPVISFGLSLLDNGVLLFICYLFFLLFFNLNLDFIIYTGLITLLLVPVNQLAKIIYSAQTLAGLAILILFTAVIRLINYYNGENE